MCDCVVSGTAAALCLQSPFTTNPNWVTRRRTTTIKRSSPIGVSRRPSHGIAADSNGNFLDKSFATEEKDLVRTVEDFKLGGGCNLGPAALRKKKQLIKRSNMIAKQVISIHSALSRGFVSQLWLDTNSWMVLVVEVRPNLLSGESERFLLQDTNQVGDVVLIEDESVMETDFKMVGLESLVGYSVVTSSRQRIGKVRGYTFNINSGAIESLELDSFGISIIPSSLVSTYALLVEDVLEVGFDTVVVHEAAASRIQRLTKGFWDAQKLGYYVDDIEEYSELDRQPPPSDSGRGKQRRSSGHKQPRTSENTDGWELPMDYL